MRRAGDGEIDQEAIQQGLDDTRERDAAVQQQAKEFKAFNDKLEVGIATTTHTPEVAHSAQCKEPDDTGAALGDARTAALSS